MLKNTEYGRKEKKEGERSEPESRNWSNYDKFPEEQDLTKGRNSPERRAVRLESASGEEGMPRQNASQGECATKG